MAVLPLLAAGLHVEDTSEYFAAPSRSPDGRWRAYTRVHRLRILHEDTESEGDVSYVELRVQSTKSGKSRRVAYCRGWGPAPVLAGWSPDSRRVLYFTVEYGSSSANADGSTLYDVPVRGGRSRELGGLMRDKDYMKFSPDGRYFLLVDGRSRFAVEAKRLLVIDYRTGSRRRLTGHNEAAIDPEWSPDSNWVAFVSTPDHGTMGSNGEPDGPEARSARERLYVIRRNGTHRRRLTNDPKYADFGPHWVAGGRLIRFTRRANGDKPKLSDWEIRPDGSGLRRLQTGK